MKQQQSNSIGFKNWLVILVTGLAGQLCWHVENQWFTTYVYAKIAPNPDIISGMVVLSAITSTFAVVFFGTLSDRVGRRKPLMVAGYIIWGITVMLFGLTEYTRAASLALAGGLTVFADCVMTFFGSLAHDAGFNPWTSDITNEHNRGSLGAVISVLPVLATIIGSLVFGNVIDAVDYTAFFFILGGVMVGIGLFTLFFLKDAPDAAPHRDEKGFWHQFFSFFSFKPLKDKLLRWVLIIFMTYFIGFQMYFSHITNEHNRGSLGAVISVLPVLATIIGSLVFG
ncbi:MAG: MFS transporter, partial [Oscillospiraceae bacterium]|nr:MFS transporter [Oscillospiraceae bacterium]